MITLQLHIFSAALVRSPALEAYPLVIKGTPATTTEGDFAAADFTAADFSTLP